jgi:hypothetical protein
MIAIAVLIVCMLCDCFKSRRRLATEILVLRHQLNVLQQHTPRRLHLRWADRALFIWLYRRCPRILDAITIVRPGTVVVLGEAHLRRILTKYAAYYTTRTLRSIAPSRTSAASYLRPSSADFITITAESDFRYRQA